MVTLHCPGSQVLVKVFFDGGKRTCLLSVVVGLCTVASLLWNSFPFQVFSSSLRVLHDPPTILWKPDLT